MTSWVIRVKETKKAICETSLKRVVDALNKEKYEAIPIRQHLEEIAAQIKSGNCQAFLDSSVVKDSLITQNEVKP